MRLGTASSCMLPVLVYDVTGLASKIAPGRVPVDPKDILPGCVAVKAGDVSYIVQQPLAGRLKLLGIVVY